MAKRVFQGSLVALVTPFRDGKVDEPTLKQLVEFQIAGGTDAIVPCGTTGESPTLDHEEHRHVIDLVIQAVNKRIPVVAGTGSNSTAEAISLTKHAKAAGADAALIVLPYYNKPTQKGLIDHCRAIADAAGLPLILYNIPGRTGVNMLHSNRILACPSSAILVARPGRVLQCGRFRQAASTRCPPSRRRAIWWLFHEGSSLPSGAV